MSALFLVSWNVNGIRACYSHGFLAFVKKYKPDILALQEIKATPDKLPKELVNLLDYESIWYPAKRRGYAGTAVYTKAKPTAVKYGTGIKEFDDEGRVITLEFKKFFFINAYFPNSQHELTRLKFKIKFDREILKYMEKLRKKKPVVICGDFNVAHKEIDLANPKQNEQNAGFTIEERREMNKILRSGYIDTFRMFVKEGGHYSWWTYRFNARARNIGWRVDYFLVSKELEKKVKDAFILEDVHGSDHAPVGVRVKI